MTEMREKTKIHHTRQILPILACVALMTTACSIGDTTNNNTNNGNCNAAGGNNSVNCPSTSTAARASVAASALSASFSSSDGKTWTETTFSRSDTFADFVNAGDLGTPLNPQQAVQVSCRVKGFAVHDGDRWWYRLAQSPWNNRYYTSADNFYNTPTPTGNPINGILFDKRVPIC